MEERRLLLAVALSLLVLTAYSLLFSPPPPWRLPRRLPSSTHASGAWSWWRPTSPSRSRTAARGSSRGRFRVTATRAARRERRGPRGAAGGPPAPGTGDPA